MSSTIPTREQAYNLLREYNKNESLIKHALAVEGVMRYFARKRGEDEEKWGVIGLIHDLDYEKFPEQHCQKTEEILKENSWPFLAPGIHTSGSEPWLGNLFGCGAANRA